MEVKETDNPGVGAGAGRGPAVGACALPTGPEARAGVSLLERLLTFNGLYKKGPDGVTPVHN